MAEVTFSSYFIGVVVETKVKSPTGSLLYSEETYEEGRCFHLNQIARIPLIGVIGGVFRMVLAFFHTVGHCIARIVTGKVGHAYHARKGLAEFLRGLIEVISLGTFGQFYTGSWWMITIHDPTDRGSFDNEFRELHYYVNADEVPN